MPIVPRLISWIAGDCRLRLCIDRNLWSRMITMILDRLKRCPMLACMPITDCWPSSVTSDSCDCAGIKTCNDCDCVFNRDGFLGYPVVSIVPRSRMGIVPRSSSVISGDCDYAWVAFHNMSWWFLGRVWRFICVLIEFRDIWWSGLRLWLDQVSWHVMIVPESNVKIAPTSSFVTFDDCYCAKNWKKHGIPWMLL